MKKVITLFTILYGIMNAPLAQVSVNNNGAAPAASSMLDVSASNKGMLMPRMTAAQRKAIANPATGLMVFDTDRQAICFFDGQEWRPLISGTEKTPVVIQRTGSNSEIQGRFGYSVAMHGNYTVVGAPRDSTSGAAYIFVKENGNWKQQAKLVASYIGSNDEFGSSVDIYNDIVVVGAPGMKVGANERQGRVYIFKRTGNNWNQVIGLQANSGQAHEQFGTAVSIYGNTIAIGAPYRDHTNFTDAGAVYIVRNTSGSWEHRITVHAPELYSQNGIGFGAALDLHDTTLLVGAPLGAGSGAAYSFSNTDVLGYSWISKQKFIPDPIPGTGKGFGTSVALSATSMIIGMPQYTFYDKGEDGGLWQTYKFNSNNGTWYKTQLIGSYKAYTREGCSVAVDGDTFYIGSEGWTEVEGAIEYKGRVIIFDNNQLRHIYNVDKDIHGFFGASVAADNGQYIIGAPAISSNTIGTVSFGISLQ